MKTVSRLQVRLRRLLQAMAFAILVVAPILGLHGVKLNNRWGPEELDRRYGPFAALVSGWMDALGPPNEELPGALVGSTWSIGILGIEFTDPIAAATLALGGAAPPLVFGIGALLVLGIHVLLGRFFCGWLCPYGILSRGVARLRRPLRRRGWTLSLTIPTWVRFAVLGVLLLLPLVGATLVPLALPYLAVGRTLHGLVFGGAAAAGGVVLAFLLVDLLLTDYGVCRGVCPSGALQHLFGRYRALRLTPTKGVRCESGCTACLGACWLGLDPRKAFADPDCDGCGRCMPVCPTTRLQIGMHRPKRWAGTPTVLGRKAKRRPRAAAGLGLLFGAGATLVLGPLGASCAGEPPVLVSGTAPWSSPFMPPAEPELQADICFEHHVIDGRALEVGRAVLPSGEFALRLYLEEEPGTPWRGPLAVRVAGRSGAARVEFEGPGAPRSVPRPSLYEARLSGSGALSIGLLDGPLAGASAPLCDPARVHSTAARAGAPALAVLLLFIGLKLRRHGPHRRNEP